MNKYIDTLSKMIEYINKKINEYEKRKSDIWYCLHERNITHSEYLKLTDEYSQIQKGIDDLESRKNAHIIARKKMIEIYKRDKLKKELIIEIDGGIVVRVYSSIEDLVVNIVDKDCHDNDSLEQADKLHKKIQDKNYKVVY